MLLAGDDASGELIEVEKCQGQVCHQGSPSKGVWVSGESESTFPEAPKMSVGMYATENRRAAECKEKRRESETEEVAVPIQFPMVDEEAEWIGRESRLEGGHRQSLAVMRGENQTM